MATINTTTWQYTYTGSDWKQHTWTIKNWSNVSDSQVQQLTNAANSSGGKVTITNDTSNAGYWNQRWSGNLMYNSSAAINDMYADWNWYAVTSYSNWAKEYRNQATWEKISESTYKNILSNTSALWLNSSVKWLSNTYWDLGGASSKPKYQWFGTMTGYNPSLTVANLWGGYQFGTMAEQAEKNSPWYLEWRNNELASALLNSWITDQAWIRDFLSQYEWFTSYDATGQDNTVQAIYNRIWQMQSWLGNNEWENMLGDQMMTWAYWDTVNSILNSAFGIGDMDSIKDMYGSDVYYSMMNALKDVEWTWNATDPASRSQLQWYLQEIIGSAVWTWVDQSKLNLAMNAILSNFTDAAQKQIQQDVLAVQNLQTKWMSADQIAKQTWMSKDQVNQLVLLSQWMPSQIWKYYEMNNDAEDLITEDYERNRENLAQQYKFNLEVANQEITQLREDFNKTYLDQQEANENTLHNMDLIAWMTGTWYSRRWLEGMSYAQQQANAVLNNLIDNYDRNNLDIANSIKSMTMAYQQNDAELVDQMNDAILNAKNNYIAQVSNIQSKYWLVWLEWQQAIAQAVQWFVNQAETIYNNAFNRAWTNTNNLISAVSSIWAIEQQQMQTKQMKIAEFQQDSMYMTQNQLRDYAQKNWLQMEYQQLVWYQQEATINTLNSVSPWLWNQYANKISQMLSKWYTPQQAVSEILNSDEVKSMTGGNRAVSGDYIYDKNTWEVRSLSQMMTSNNSTWYTTQQIQQEVWAYAQQWTTQYTEWQQINKQCGALANDYLQSLWLGRVFTDPIEAKAAAINSNTPTVWSVVVMTSPYENSKKYGHVAIVTGINNDGTMNLARANTNWDKAYHTWTKKINSSDILGYYDPSIELAKQYGATNWNMNGGNSWATTDYWIPISYDRSIKAMIPTQLMNSELELNKLESNIKSLYQQWYNAEDAVLTYMWFNVTNDSDKQIAMNLVNSVRSLSNEDSVQSAISYISQRINAGDYSSAIAKVENLVREEARQNEWDWYFAESTAKSIVSKVNELQSLLQKNWYSVWVVKWTFQKWLKNLKSSDQARIQTLVSYLTDPQVLKNAWTNLSAGEMDRIRSRVPQLNDKPETFMNKLNDMKNNSLTDLNSWRTTYWLPALDENSLVDNKAKVNLYTWRQTSSSWWGRWL